MRLEKRLEIAPDMAELQPDMDSEEQFRDPNRLIPRHEQRFSGTLAVWASVWFPSGGLAVLEYMVKPG